MEINAPIVSAERPTLSGEALARKVGAFALDRKCLAVTVVDLRGRSSYADFLVIGSGTSDRHVEAVANHVVFSLKKDFAIAPIGQEGLKTGQWALVDFGSVVLHVFHEFSRMVYDLDGLWRDAPRLTL